MRKLLIVIALLPLLLLSYIGIINLLPDEELSSGAAAWLASDSTVPPKEENSHYLLWGLEAPADVSMWEYGEAVVENIVQSDAPPSDFSNYESYLPDGFDNGARINTVGMGMLCELSQDYCLDVYRSGVDALLAQGDNALLLERYREMSALQHYHSVEPMDAYTIPPFSPLTDGQRLRHVYIASRYLNGERAAALGELASDLRFSRMLMAEADTLIVRMVAIKMVASDLYLYSQLMEQPDAGAVLQTVAELAPLSREERDIEMLLQGELRFTANAFSQLEDEQIGLFGEGGVLSYLEGMLPVRQSRLINLNYAYFKKMAELSELPPSQVEARYNSATEELFSEPGVLDYLYDPITSVLLGIAIPDLSHYVLRHHDLNGLIRLVKLKGEIIGKSVPVEDLESYITASPYASAYLQEMAAIRWNSEQQTLSYTPANRDDSDYFNLSQLHMGQNRVNGGEVGGQ